MLRESITHVFSDTALLSQKVFGWFHVQDRFSLQYAASNLLWVIIISEKQIHKAVQQLRYHSANLEVVSVQQQYFLVFTAITKKKKI